MNVRHQYSSMVKVAIAGLQLGGVTEKLGGVRKFNGVITFLTTLNF